MKNENIIINTKKQNRWDLYILILIVVMFGLWKILNYNSTSNYLSKRKKYTVTTNIKMGPATRVSGVSYIYEFTVNSKDYYGNIGGVKDSKKVYFVEFYPPDLSINRLTFVEADNLDVKNIPAFGIDHLPHK